MKDATFEQLEALRDLALKNSKTLYGVGLDTYQSHLENYILTDSKRQVIKDLCERTSIIEAMWKKISCMAQDEIEKRIKNGDGPKYRYRIYREICARTEFVGEYESYEIAFDKLVVLMREDNAYYKIERHEEKRANN